MVSRNTTAQGDQTGSFTCRTRRAGDTGLVECLMKTIGCPWVLCFGDTRYCKHPSAGQSAKLNQP